MQKIYFHIFIKSFEHSILQSVKEKIENLSVFLHCVEGHLDSSTPPEEWRGGVEGRLDSMKALSSSIGSSAYGSEPVKHQGKQKQEIPLAVLDINKNEKSYSSTAWRGASTYLPSCKKRFTLLRSPHIDKKSREQFQLHTFKAKIDTTCYTRGKASFFLLLLRNSELMGVELKVAVNYSTPLFP